MELFSDGKKSWGVKQNIPKKNIAILQVLVTLFWGVGEFNLERDPRAALGDLPSRIGGGKKFGHFAEESSVTLFRTFPS